MHPGNTSSSNNVLAFIEGCKTNHIISARLTQALKQVMVDLC